MNKALTLLLSLAVVLGGAGCGQQADSAAEETQEPGARTIPVAVTPLESGTAQNIVEAWGTVYPQQEAKILAGLSGTLTRSLVQLGQTVSKDQPLVEIDPGLYQAKFDEAEARVRGAEVAMSRAMKNMERATALLESKKISDQEYETTSLNRATAMAEKAAARAALEQATINLRDARPVAPFAGSVANRVPDAGTSVSLGELLVHLVDLNRVLVVAEVSEKDLASIAPGAAATLSMEGSDRAFTGVVRGLGPQANQDSRQFPVEIEVDNPGRHLKAGMITRVQIVVEEFENVPLLPLEALVERSGTLGYFVVEGDKAVWRAPVLGPRTQSHAAILAGGDSQESVVILGQSRLRDGASVKVEAAP